MRERILSIFQSLPPERGIEDRGVAVWMKCPIHGGGHERTASFKVSTEGQFAGSYFCFSCGIHGGWKKLVGILGFGPDVQYAINPEAIVSDAFTDDEVAILCGEISKRRLIEYREEWPADQEWRGIPGSTIQEVGGTMILGGDGREPILRLPAMIRSKEVGYIDCIIHPNKDTYKKYFNSSGNWTHDALYPYDAVRRLPKSQSVVALVEGPRDALACIANGLPALATLGASSWSDSCARLIEAIAPETLILMLDPDEAGETLRHRVYSELCDILNIQQIRLPSKLSDGRRVKLADPADLSRKQLQKILSKID